MAEEDQRKDELIKAIEAGNQKAEQHLERYISSHIGLEPDAKFHQQLGEIRTFLTSARGCLDELLDLRKQDDIPTPGKPLTDPVSKGKEIAFVSEVVYNAEMSLKLREKLDHSGLSQADKLHSVRHHIQAYFILAELYLASGVRIDDAKRKYEQITIEGPGIFKQMRGQEDDNLIIPMIRLAYKIGTSYKRLLDIEYKVFETIPRSVAVSDDNRTELVPLNYGTIMNKDGRIEQHERYKHARSWFFELFDLNQKARLTDLEKLEFSKYEFNLYRKDVAELRAGCVFNVFNGESMECISEICEKGPLCSNRSDGNEYSLKKHEIANMIARAQLKLGKL